MSSVNVRRRTATQSARFPLQTHEGGGAISLSSDQELTRTVLCCLMGEDNFYESGADVATRIQKLVAACDPAFVANLAITARSDFNLRHVPQFLITCLADLNCVTPNVVEACIQRPDDMTELLALWWRNGKRGIPNALKKGMKLAFAKFDSYQLRKWQQRERTISLRDIMFLVHPKPSDEEMSTVYEQLADRTAEPPDTWEVAISAAGSDVEVKKREWTRLLTDNRLGAMALLRNLRNMEELRIPQNIVRTAIANANVRRVLPFRFLSAALAAPAYQDVLNDKFLEASRSLEPLPGHSVVCIDTSGSMSFPISGKSIVQRAQVAACLAAIFMENCDHVTVLQFGSNVAEIPARRGLNFPLKIEYGAVGHGTNIAAAVSAANRLNPDRVIVVSDMQSHTSIGAPHGVGYMINVAPYEFSIAFGPWLELSGWSDDLVRFMPEYEKRFI